MRGLRLLEMGFGHVGRSNCVWTVGNVVWMGGGLRVGRSGVYGLTGVMRRRFLRGLSKGA